MRGHSSEGPTGVRSTAGASPESPKIRRMDFTLNGAARSAAAPVPLPALLEELALAGRRVAVELNGAIVPRSAWGETALREGDTLEIVHAIGGG